MKKSLYLLLVGMVSTACMQRTSPLDLLSGASEKVRKEKSAELLISTATKFRLEVTSVPSLDYTTIGVGFFDFDRKIGRITFDFSSLIAKAGQAGTQIPSKQTYIVDQESVYIEIPEAARPKTQGKSWLKIETEKIASSTGLDIGSFGTSDPAKSLDYFKEVAESDIETIGPERIRGVATTHFRATISLDDLLRHVPEDRRPQVAEQMRSSEITEIPLDVWVDDDGLPRKWSIQIADSQRRFESNTIIEISDYGKQLKISLPDSEDVFAASSDQEIAEILGYQLPR